MLALPLGREANSVVIEKILTHLDSKDPSTAPARLPRSRAPPQSSLFG